jgi:uncharacterized protein (TIGR00251 family)
MNWFRWDGPALLLSLKLQPGASRSEFAGLHGDHLKVRIHAPAIEGRANAELLAFLSSSFAVGKSSLSIERGELGRIKTVRIATPRQLPEVLLELGLTPPAT